MLDQAGVAPQAPVPAPGHASRLFRIGKTFDVLMCVILFNGDGSETMSRYAGRRRAEGAGWACPFCRLLAIVVEPHHCSRTLADQTFSRVAFWRAAAAFILPLILLHWLIVIVASSI